MSVRAARSRAPLVEWLVRTSRVEPRKETMCGPTNAAAIQSAPSRRLRLRCDVALVPSRKERLRRDQRRRRHLYGWAAAVSCSAAARHITASASQSVRHPCWRKPLHRQRASRRPPPASCASHRRRCEVAAAGRSSAQTDTENEVKRVVRIHPLIFFVLPVRAPACVRFAPGLLLEQVPSGGLRDCMLRRAGLSTGTIVLTLVAA